MTPELGRRIGSSENKMRRYSKQIFDAKGVWLKVKVMMYKAEVLPALLYGCETWTLKSNHTDKLQTTHRLQLNRLIGFKKKKRLTDHPLSYRKALLITGCETIETTIHKLRLKLAGRIVRMSDERLPKLMLFGELDGGQRRRGRPEKSWRNCLRDSLRAFEIDEKSWIKLADEGDEEWMKLITDSAEQHMERWHEGALRDHHRRRRRARAEEDENKANDDDIPPPPPPPPLPPPPRPTN